MATALGLSSLVEFFFRSRHSRHLVAAQSIIAVLLFCSPFTAFPDYQSTFERRIQRGTIKKVAMVVAAVVLVTGGLSNLPTVTRRPAVIMDNHPIEQLIRTSRYQFSAKLAKQSQTLPEAVQEYQRRNGMHPPPKFDKWFEFARVNNIQMIDEYDTIQDLLKPFWGISPAIIRARAREAFGAEETHLSALLIRAGDVANRTVQTWVTDALVDVLRPFVQELPDMDLLFNIHDEPSVVVPHDMLGHLVVEAGKQQAQSLTHTTPVNAFSKRPADLVDSIPQHYGTEVIHISRQTAWTYFIQSCPLDSPVRNITGGTDLTSSYATEPFGFISNTTAFSNVCNQPSLPFHHGFFDRPNSMQYCSTLAPVFSAAKVSSFNDILFPSMWLYTERTRFDESKDVPWNQKRDQMHWRGSTTSGFARDGGWRRHHRQRFVKALDAIKDPVPILRRLDDNGNAWMEDTMSPSAAQQLFDVKFSSINDASVSADYEAQKQEFRVAPMEDQQELWKWKYLLDIDGHGMSGRFYPLMKSQSLVFKCAMFREWHDEWLQPWVHYIPLGLEGTDWFEVLRFFDREESGRLEAERIAAESREWANKVLRRVDMEAWVFRLLLEYINLCARLTLGMAG
jgi:hypothetical protein